MKTPTEEKIVEWEKQFDEKFLLVETFSRGGFDGLSNGGTFKNVRNDIYGIKHFIRTTLQRTKEERDKEILAIIADAKLDKQIFYEEISAQAALSKVAQLITNQ